MLCPKCGNILPDDASFCDNCGTNVQNVKNTDVPKQEFYHYEERRVQDDSKKGLGVVIGVLAGVITVLVIAIVAIVLANMNGQKSGEQVPLSTVTQQPAPEEPKVSIYRAVKTDITWTDARYDAERYGGQLVCINDKEEFEKVCRIADEKNIKVFWVGARRHRDDSWYDTNWLDKSEINFTKWFKNEPTYVSEEGMDEMYLMVFNVDGEWYFNDAENNVERFYKGRMGYIIETEE